MPPPSRGELSTPNDLSPRSFTKYRCDRRRLEAGPEARPTQRRPWQAGDVSGRAWVSETLIDEDLDARTAIAAARFLSHVEDESLPEGFAQGPPNAPPVGALGWARSRADVVVPRIYERDGTTTMYSAGSKPATGFRPRLQAWEDIYALFEGDASRSQDSRFEAAGAGFRRKRQPRYGVSTHRASHRGSRRGGAQRPTPRLGPAPA
jgi:hypothetical protein